MPTSFPTTLLERLEKSQKVALDGINMVVVTREARPAPYLYVVFYLVTSEGMVKIDALSELDDGEDYTVFVAGGTAVLEFPGDCGDSDAQIVYKQNKWGYWEKEEDTRCKGLGGEDDKEGSDVAQSPPNSSNRWIPSDSWFVKVMLGLVPILLLM